MEFMAQRLVLAFFEPLAFVERMADWFQLQVLRCSGLKELLPSLFLKPNGCHR